MTLTERDKLTPVNVAIWDSGIDVAVFPSQLFTDPVPSKSGTQPTTQRYVRRHCGRERASSRSSSQRAISGWQYTSATFSANGSSHTPALRRNATGHTQPPSNFGFVRDRIQISVAIQNRNAVFQQA